MKKTFLTAAWLGVLAIPAVSLVSCIGTADQKEKDDKQVITPRDAYRTALGSTPTIDFEIGQFYSAEQIGINKVFGQDYNFEVQSYDDLTGQIVVNIHHDNTDGSSSLLKSGVRIIGFKKTNPLDFINNIRTKTLKQGVLETTLIENQKPSWFDKGGATYSVSDLGIEHYFNFRQAEHQIKIHSQDDSVGQIEALMVIKLGGKAVSCPLTISGFLVDQDLREKVELVRKVLNQIGDAHETRLTGQWASGIVGRIHDADFWDLLGIASFPEKEALENHGIKIQFSSAHANDKQGSLTFEITLSFDHHGVKHSESKKIKVTGFSAKDPKYQNEDQVKAQKIKNYLQNTFDKKSSTSGKMPSEVEKDFRGNLTDLGLKDLPTDLVSGAELNFRVENPDDDQGVLTLIVNIKVGQVELSVNLLIEGYKTSLEDQQEKARVKEFLKELIAWIENNRSTTKFFKNKLASQLGLETGVSFEKLGIAALPDEKTQGAKITFKLDDVDDENGLVHLLITASKQTVDVEKKIVIKGFLNYHDHLENLHGKISSQITSYENKTPSDLLKEHRKKPGDEINFNQLGIKELSEEEKRGASVTMVLKSFDDLTGKVTVDLTLKIGKKQLTKVFTISGYKISPEAVRNQLGQFARKVQENLSKRFQQDKEHLPSQYGAPGAKFLSLWDRDPIYLDAQSMGIDLEITIDAVDDDKGTLTLKISLEKNRLKLEDQFVTISGLKTNELEIDEWTDKIREANQADRSGEIRIRLKQESSWFEKDKDPRKLTLEQFEDDFYEFNITLPRGVTNAVSLKWTLNPSQSTADLLVVSLQISRGQSSQILNFKISGFEKLAKKLINEFFDQKITNHKVLKTTWSEVLVSQFKINESYTKEELGIEDFPELTHLSELKNFDLEFKVIELDDKWGRIVTEMSVTSDDYIRSRRITINGFWSDQDRREASIRVQREMSKIFGDFYFKGQLSALSEEQMSEVLAYDQTLLGKFIGDDNFWNPGQRLSLEDLNLSKNAALLRKWVEQLGSKKVKLEFEIVERPAGTSFYGSISLKPVVHYVDKEITSDWPFVIAGFQSFESFFHASVSQISQKLPDQVKQGYSGSVVAFLDRLTRFDKNRIENSLRTFDHYPIGWGKRVTHIRELLKTARLEESVWDVEHQFGNYKLMLIDVLAKPIKVGEHHTFNQDRYEFEFLWGLSSDVSGFNFKVWSNESNLSTNKNRYDRLYRGKRSFTKMFVGFATHDQIVNTTERTYDEYLAKNEFLPMKHSPLPWSVKSVIQTTYKQDISKYQVDLADPDAINQWHKNINRENSYFKYVNMPIDWTSFYGDMIGRPNIREVVLSARPYFRLSQVELRDDQAIMSFKVGFRFGRFNNLMDYAYEWPELKENRQWHDANELKLIDTVVKIKVSK